MLKFTVSCLDNIELSGTITTHACSLIKHTRQITTDEHTGGACGIQQLSLANVTCEIRHLARN